ncbi:MAG: 3-oxoadipate enol-lactonase [Candidatus Binatia bacterium]|nr:MAG: 3-oxoadipate enol-lactonase [Candidatus Binatia bacterium]
MPYAEARGTKLFYEDVGSGEPTLLFLHGWCCDHTTFAPQLEHFRERHRVVAPDLRGHGRSEKPEGPYTMETLADDVAQLARALGLRQAVVLGHSMGGLVALSLAAREPELVAAVVTLDSPILPPPEVRATLEELARRFRGADFPDAQRSLVSDRLFLPTDEPEIRERVSRIMLSAPQHVAAAAFEGIAAFDHESAVQALRVPWLALFASEPPTDIASLRLRVPHVMVGRTVGAGHFHQLVVPDQVHAMVERFLRVSGLLGRELVRSRGLG